MRTERQAALFHDADAAGDFRVWSAPDEAHRVDLESELVRELRYTAIQAFLAIPKRGLEIGGLLLGEVKKGRPAVFEVTGFADVPCEHRFGPAYTLDEPDRVALAAMIARYARDGAVRVVGFYRSYTGRDAEPDEVDRELVRMFFRSGEFVWLSLQPVSSENCVAGFRFCNDGEMSQQSGSMFPFAVAQMERQEVAAPPPVIAASATWPQPQDLNDRPEHRGRGEFHVPRFTDPQIAEEQEWVGIEGEEPNPRAALQSWVSVMLVFITVVLASAALYELWGTEREARWASVHLDARRDVGGLLVTWDARTPVVAGATRGFLHVNDGRKPTTVQLSQEQLLRGSVTYPDTGSDVLFSLSLDGSGTKTVTESLRVIMSSPIPGQTPAPPADEVAAPAQRVESPPPVKSALVESGSASHPKAAKPALVRREVRPEIPAGIRSRIATQKVVEVQVRIDENGRVTSASSKAAGDGVDKYLADQAVKAARQWVFWPARSTAGEPVSATKTIPFEFAPGAH